MRSASGQWPPRRGVRVWIPACGLATTVSIVEGKDCAQLFILEIDGPATRIACRLDELAPHPP
jgi:hypothetical protein